MRKLLFLLAFLPVLGFAQHYELKFKKLVTTRAEDFREPLSEKRLSGCMISIDTQQGKMIIKEGEKETEVKIKQAIINEEDVLNITFEHELYIKGFLSKINGKYSLILTIKDYTFYYYV
ncbi:MAG: hypothetical protein K0S32_1079 [Bacteroidetes bacterium]|jgi:hypothetical protein|nr:hypothetical protein [Bacteroidota bacterium]